MGERKGKKIHDLANFVVRKNSRNDALRDHAVAPVVHNRS
jgi:hypothetical protein